MQKCVKEAFLIQQIYAQDPDSELIQTFLETYTDAALFALAIQSTILNTIVEGFLEGSTGEMERWNSGVTCVFFNIFLV